MFPISMLFRGGRSDSGRRAVALALALVILGIAAYVFSGLHRHDPLSNSVCSFSDFEHGAGLEGGGHVDIIPTVQCRWRAAEKEGVHAPGWQTADEGCRAPPACC